MATVPIKGVRGRLATIVVGLAALVAAGVFLLVRHRPLTSPIGVAAVERAPSDAAPLPAPAWTAAQLGDLLASVKAADAEGLRSSDYQRDALQVAIDGGRTGAAVDGLADGAARSLAHDYAAGRVRNRHRFNWYVDYAGPDAAQLAAQVTAARERGELASWLAGLLPTAAAYRALHDALAATPADDTERRARIKANMERWRWLPRDFGGGDQLYVNLPTYQLDLVRDGQTVSSYRAVIGATDMPTPVLSSMVRQVIVNPDWIVPQSIVRKSHLRPSAKYQFITRPDGTVRVRQKPGAGNALGKVKIQFPNKLAIYFHDTPSRSLFGASARAFSHGCVRVQHIDALAAAIVGDDDRLATALAGSATRSFRTDRPLRANIVYLTLVPDQAGGLADVGDPYKMDRALALALDPSTPAVQARLPDPAALAEPLPAPAAAPARPARPARAPADTGLVAPNAEPADPIIVDPPAEVAPAADQDHAPD